MRRCAPGTALLLATCAVMAAGCAMGPGTAVSAVPRERAVIDATAILRAFVVPPGGRRLQQAPDALKAPITTVVSTTLVDKVSFWRAPGQPQAVLAWEQVHLSGRFTPGDEDFGPPSWDRTFSLSPVPGVLNARDLVVEVTGAGNGQTAIRVDAQVSWQPPRPAAAQVPAAARVVTITQLPGFGPPAKGSPEPVTITDPAVVRRLTALVDNLQVSTIGPGAPCPRPLGGGIRLMFLARVGGQRQPALQLTASFIPQVLKLAGLHWKVT